MKTLRGSKQGSSCSVSVSSDTLGTFPTHLARSVPDPLLLSEGGLCASLHISTCYILWYVITLHRREEFTYNSQNHEHVSCTLEETEKACPLTYDLFSHKHKIILFCSLKCTLQPQHYAFLFPGCISTQEKLSSFSGCFQVIFNNTCLPLPESTGEVRRS